MTCTWIDYPRLIWVKISWISTISTPPLTKVKQPYSMHPAICRLQIFFHCFINSYNTSKQKSWFINACKSIKMAFEVSWEVPPDRAFLLASVQMAPQLKWWQPVWGDRPFLISSFYESGIGWISKHKRKKECIYRNSNISSSFS